MELPLTATRNIESARRKAMIPPTQVCQLGCHSVVKTESAKLAPIRASWDTGQGHSSGCRSTAFPDHVYFDS